MELAYLAQGLIIGFVIAVPAGPLGLLCISRALSGGPAYGLYSGLGVATADAISSGIAILAMRLALDLLLSQQLWLHLIGGLFLCFLGCRTFLAESGDRVVESQSDGLAEAYASTFFLTLTNPVTILSFIVIYSGWGVGHLGRSYASSALLASGVFFGSAFWWFILAGGLAALPGRFSRQWVRWVQRVSGAIIAGFGLLVLLSFYKGIGG